MDTKQRSVSRIRDILIVSVSSLFVVSSVTWNWPIMGNERHKLIWLLRTRWWGNDPPLGFMLMDLAYTLLPTDFGLRIPDILLGSLTVGLLFVVAREHYGFGPAALATVSLLSTYPFLATSGRAVFEGVTLFFMFSCSYAALNEKYLCAGILGGLAVLSKHHGLIILPAVFLAVMIHKREAIRSKRFWIGSGISLFFLYLLLFQFGMRVLGGKGVHYVPAYIWVLFISNPILFFTGMCSILLREKTDIKFLCLFSVIFLLHGCVELRGNHYVYSSFPFLALVSCRFWQTLIGMKNLVNRKLLKSLQLSTGRILVILILVLSITNLWYMWRNELVIASPGITRRQIVDEIGPVVYRYLRKGRILTHEFTFTYYLFPSEWGKGHAMYREWEAEMAVDGSRIPDNIHIVILQKSYLSKPPIDMYLKEHDFKVVKFFRAIVRERDVYVLVRGSLIERY